MRAPTPEVATLSRSQEGPRRPAREEAKKLKVNMPPPDYIPSHTGPQRPMSATELGFPHFPPSERAPTSGPQRVLRTEAMQAGAGAARTGPIRPPFPMQGAAPPAEGAQAGARD